MNKKHIGTLETVLYIEVVLSSEVKLYNKVFRDRTSIL